MVLYLILKSAIFATFSLMLDLHIFVVLKYFRKKLLFLNISNDKTNSANFVSNAAENAEK